VISLVMRSMLTVSRKLHGSRVTEVLKVLCRNPMSVQHSTDVQSAFRWHMLSVMVGSTGTLLAHATIRATIDKKKKIRSQIHTYIYMYLKMEKLHLWTTLSKV
jgi:hypothetical protein